MKEGLAPEQGGEVPEQGVDGGAVGDDRGRGHQPLRGSVTCRGHYIALTHGQVQHRMR